METKCRGLSGAGAEGERQALPVVAERERRRQVQHDASHRQHHLGAELEHVLAQGGDLGPGPAGVRRPEPQLLQQDIGGGGQQHAQLVGEEARAARAVDLEAMMEFLEPVSRSRRAGCRAVRRAAAGCPGRW